MQQMEFASSNSLYDASLLPDGVIHWSEAGEHIGESVIVYGEVTSTYFDWRKYDAECERWASYPDVEIKVPPTFIEIGAKYPSEDLLKVVIWGRDRNGFEQSPDALYKDKAVLIKGEPYKYNDLVHVKVTCSEDMSIIEPIAGLYVAPNEETLTAQNYRPVFARAFRAASDDCKDDNAYEFEDGNSDLSFYEQYDLSYVINDRGDTEVEVNDCIINEEGEYVPTDIWLSEHPDYRYG